VQELVGLVGGREVPGVVKKSGGRKGNVKGHVVEIDLGHHLVRRPIGRFLFVRPATVLDSVRKKVVHAQEDDRAVRRLFG